MALPPKEIVELREVYGSRPVIPAHIFHKALGEIERLREVLEWLTIRSQSVVRILEEDGPYDKIDGACKAAEAGGDDG